MMIRLIALATTLVWASGCSLLPERVHQPCFHNPFPQLSKVAVAPFFNLSSEKSVDGRQFAIAYYNELQLVPGFEVVPVGVVEQKIESQHLSLGNADDIRRLAQMLEVDAVVVGAVTDFSPYYPPRCGLRVEWYAANPGFHPIPPGYGLPWGTTQEEYIPQPVVFDAEMALARAQLKTQSPAAGPGPLVPPLLPPGATSQKQSATMPNAKSPDAKSPDAKMPDAKSPPTAPEILPAPGAAQAKQSSQVRLASQQTPVTGTAPAAQLALAVSADGKPNLPPDWPDARAFIPASPQCERPPLLPNNEPVMRHTRVYNGHDAEFTAALQNYVFFRDDSRFGGWQSYLQRSDDFIRFCCYKHIAEMLTERGGAGETRVVWRWPTDR